MKTEKVILAAFLVLACAYGAWFHTSCDTESATDCHMREQH